jgi:hypothetical protein
VEVQTAGLFVGGEKDSLNGLTFHVLGGAYNPPVVTVNPPVDPTVDTPIQDAVDAAAPGSLIVVSPGSYHENVIMHNDVKLQGFGHGGAVGAPPPVTPDPPPELPGPEDPFATVGGEEPYGHIQGSVIDARYFSFNNAKIAAWEATLAGPASPFSGPADVPGGAAITIVAQDGEFGSSFNAAIDGFGITAARGERWRCLRPRLRPLPADQQQHLRGQRLHPRRRNQLGPAADRGWAAQQRER